MSDIYEQDISLSIDSSESSQSTRLWMERGFSRREIGRRMLKAVPDLELFTSDEQPIPGVPIIAFPDLSGATSAEAVAALGTIVEAHEIDILWPQRSARFDLSSLDCTVHLGATRDVARLVDNKAAFADWLGDDPYRIDTTETIGVEAAVQEYERRRAEGRIVCIKPSIGVNGEGYWRLSETEGLNFLNHPDERDIHPDIYFAALAKQELHTKPQRLAVMDWLPGPEVSVDLLNWHGEPLIHAARTKIDAQTQRIEAEHPVLEHAHMIAAKLALHGLVSVQYRLDESGEWKILEINPRPAGGSINSEDAGFGVITEWTKLLTGRTTPEFVSQRQHRALMHLERTPRFEVIGDTSTTA